MKQLKKILALVLVAAMIFALSACKKGEDVSGKYICIGENYGGDEYYEPSEESWVELKKNGKGTYYYGFDFKLKWKLEDGKFLGTVSFLGLEETMEGTLENGLLEVTYGDMNMRFLKEGAELPADNAGDDAPANTGNEIASNYGSGTGPDIVTAGSIDEAYGNGGTLVSGSTGSDIDDGAAVYALNNPSTWYGWMNMTDFWGDIDQDDTFVDVMAYIDADGSGTPYFEMYEIDLDFAFLSMYISIEDDGTRIHPVIGVDDAWCSETYLTEADAENYEGYLLQDGTLWFHIPYEHYSGDYGYYIEVCLREYGTEWDEDFDILPNRYDEYKESIGSTGSNDEPEETDEDYGKTTPDADGVVDFDTLKEGFVWLDEYTSYENGYAKPTYEEVAEAFGCNGHKTHDFSWEPDYHVYEWVTDDGEFVLLSFKVDEDGNETWNSTSWSSGLND